MTGVLAYLGVLSWALVLLLGFLGYGSFLCRRFHLRDLPGVGVGLQMAFGMSFVLAIGGWLCALSLAHRSALVVLALVGAGLAVAETAPRAWRARGTAWRGWLARRAWLALPGLLATLWLASSVAPLGAINPNDDSIAYLTYVTRLLETGDLVEPYGLRRLLTFGGQSLLQAQVAAAGSWRNVNVPDVGFAPVLLVALVAGLVRPTGRAQQVCAALWLAAVLLLPVPRANTASVATGAVLLVALVATLDLVTRADSDADASALAFLAGLVGAAAGSLRATFLGAAVVALAGFHLARLARARGRGLREGALSLLGGLVGLAPWMVALTQSSGTPFFPLFEGNYRPEFATLSAGLGLSDSLAHVARVLSHPSFVVVWLPTLAIVGLRRRAPVLAVAAGGLVACVAAIASNTVWPIQHLHRFSWPLLSAASLATAALALRQWDEAPRRAPRDLAVAVVALGLFLPALQRDGARGWQLVRRSAAGVPAQWRPAPGAAADLATLAYAEAQHAAPVGAPLLTVVDRPYLLDYRRNRILNVDAIGAASPPPGMPFFEGPDALRSYLLDQSIEYVLARDFDTGRSLYSRRGWRDERPIPVLNEVWRPHFLDFMDNLDEIARCDEVVAAPMGVRLIRLQRGGGCARESGRRRPMSAGS